MSSDLQPQQLNATWERVRQQLRREVTDFTFHLWLDPLELAHNTQTRLFVRAPDHIRGWVRERYLHLLTVSACRALERSVSIEIVGSEWVPQHLPEGRAEPEETELNPKYTFQQFVIGYNNRFAHAAALTVAELPAQAYNPLFIHGRPGLGKTHLLHAIGNYLRRYGIGLQVRYVTVEGFTNEFIQALNSRRVPDFKQRFRTSDVLLIDDVQFLEDKAKTKEEFFHTFNALYESGRQLVIASDRGPRDLGELETRLRERFESGLVADLEPPELDARVAILRKRADLDAIAITEEALVEIATRVTASVRSLEGALIRVVAFASLQNEPPTPTLARRVLGGQPAQRQALTIDDIQRHIADAFGVSKEAIHAKDRRSEVSRARQVAIYLARELTGESLPAIGHKFERSHATVAHACRKVSRDIASDPAFSQTVSELRNRLCRNHCDHP